MFAFNLERKVANWALCKMGPVNPRKWAYKMCQEGLASTMYVSSTMEVGDIGWRWMSEQWSKGEIFCPDIFPEPIWWLVSEQLSERRPDLKLQKTASSETACFSLANFNCLLLTALLVTAWLPCLASGGRFTQSGGGAFSKQAGRRRYLDRQPAHLSQAASPIPQEFVSIFVSVFISVFCLYLYMYLCLYLYLYFYL